MKTTRLKFDTEETLLRDAESLEFQLGSSVSPWAAELIGCQLGDYILESLLGEGAMAAVFLARHRDLGDVRL